MTPLALKPLLYIMNTLADRKKDVLAVKSKDCKEKQALTRCQECVKKDQNLVNSWKCSFSIPNICYPAYRKSSP